jgi:Zn-dependent M28 family amino/carboxypeptidase
MKLQRRTTYILAALLPLTLFAAIGCAPPDEAPAADTTASTPYELPLPADIEDAAATITEEYLREVTTTLSADAFEGRGPGSPGDEAARAYLIEQLKGLGLEPGGTDGSWEQPFDIVGVEADAPKSWSFSSADGQEIALAFWDEYIASSGVQEKTAQLKDAELVFVGYGIEAPEYDWDDFKGRDLSGKVLVMLNNDPDWDDELFAGNRRLYYGRWTYKYESAARQGAAGAIIVHTTPSAGYPWQVVQTSWTGPQFELPAGDEPRHQVSGWSTWEATKKLFALGGHDLDALALAAKERTFEPVDLGISTSLVLENKVTRVATANVLALLPGSDPEISDEVVVYTAHHDHLGRGRPDADGDDIYNGALDNAAGVAQVLAIARAMKSLQAAPRRSVLFALVAGEEQGLLGSKHFAAEPTFAPGKISAAVNYDGASIWGRTRDLVFIGLGKSTTLDRVVETAAKLQDRVVVGDQFPDRGFFYRSDQFSLAKIGVPAIYLDSGTDLRDAEPGHGTELIEKWEATQYHQPSDEIDDTWKFDGMVENSRLGLYCGLALTEDDEMASWTPGDEFEAARHEALAAR